MEEVTKYTPQTWAILKFENLQFKILFKKVLNTVKKLEKYLAHMKKDKKQSLEDSTILRKIN